MVRRLAAVLVIVAGAVGAVSAVHLPTGRSSAWPSPDGSRIRPETTSALPSRALYGWGSDDWGQIGDGASGGGVPTPVPMATAVTVPAGTALQSVSAGGSHTLGLTVDGTVESWGTGPTGQLGLGPVTAATVPEEVTIPGDPTVVAVAAGSSHSLALSTTGQVYAWGSNFFGQLGNGTTTDADLPVAVDLPAGVRITAIAAGGDHSLALTTTGQVYAWGANTDGQLGDGTTTDADVPVAVPAPEGVVITAIAAGTGHSLALSTAGTAYAWGFNASGQLGNGTTTDSTTMGAVSMPDGATFSSIAAGSSHSLALTTTGQVYAWGSNVFGQLDSALVGSLPVDSTVPAQPLGLPPLTAFVAVAAGLNSSYALTSAGVAWVWGGNAYGQLGVGAPGLDAALPQVLTSLPPGTLATGLFSGPDASDAFLVTRSVQSIAYPSLPAMTYGDPPFDAAPTTDSGLDITNAVSGACTGYADHVQIVAAGVCQLSATQAGDFWFYPATAEIFVIVGRATLTIVAASTSATVGFPPTSFGYGLVGFRNQDTPSVVTGSASCTSPAGLQALAGTYPITCATGTLSAGNYTFAPGPPGTLTLVAAASGYDVVGSDGSVWALGPQNAVTALTPAYFGSLAGRPLNAPVVGAAFTPRHDGYWLAASDGGIFAFGTAGFHGSMGGTRLNRPIVGVAATPDGDGYWEVASDGGIFAFGDARFFGSTGGTRLNAPIVGMAASPDGEGYWLVAADGGIFAFGDARFMGSTGADQIGDTVVGMAATPSGDGYWIVSDSGAVFSFGQAPFEGSLRYIDLDAPVVGMAPSFDGRGYWLASSDGGVFAFGDAPYFGRPTPSTPTIDGIT